MVGTILSTANTTTPGTYTCISTEAITNCTIPVILSNLIEIGSGEAMVRKKAVIIR